MSPKHGNCANYAIIGQKKEIAAKETPRHVNLTALADFSGIGQFTSKKPQFLIVVKTVLFVCTTVLLYSIVITMRSPQPACWYPYSGTLIINKARQRAARADVENCWARYFKLADDDAVGGAAGRERSAFSEPWAATMYRSCTTVTNHHPFALGKLVMHSGVLVCEDEKRVSVVLRHPAGLAELEQGKELKVVVKEDSGTRRFSIFHTELTRCHL
jgi:hypothetical protein